MRHVERGGGLTNIEETHVESLNNIFPISSSVDSNVEVSPLHQDVSIMSYESLGKGRLTVLNSRSQLSITLGGQAMRHVTPGVDGRIIGPCFDSHCARLCLS